MGAIVWLATYPRSRTTGLRAFLYTLILHRPDPVPLDKLTKLTIGESGWAFYQKFADYTAPEQVSLAEQARIRPMVHKAYTSFGLGCVFAKTHNYFGTGHGAHLITPEYTKAAICILRNPLDVAPSYARHLGKPIDEVIEKMADLAFWTGGHGNHVVEFPSSWSFHFQTPTEKPYRQIHIVRYEDLVSKSDVGFKKIAKFLDLEALPAKLRKAIEFSRLDALRAQEEREGFRERGDRPKGPFFGTGGKKGWREKLSMDQAARIVEQHREQMTRFNYAPREFI